jgi:hypothetical protein
MEEKKVIGMNGEEVVEQAAQATAMEAGKVYNLSGVKPEEVALVVLPKEGVDIGAFIQEMSTVVRYSGGEESREVFNTMILKVLNNYLTCNVNFANAKIEEVEVEKVPTVEAEIVE